MEMEDYVGMTEDDIAFGAKKSGDIFVYCKSHVNFHRTGWCTVPVEDKIKLDATTDSDAYQECLARGFFNDSKKR